MCLWGTSEGGPYHFGTGHNFNSLVCNDVKGWHILGHLFVMFLSQYCCYF